VRDTPDAPDVVAALQEANARLRAENAELKAQIAEQAEKIARLERLISRNCLFTEQRSVFPQFSRRAATSVNTVPGHEQRGCS